MFGRSFIKETETSTSTCINDIKEFSFTSTEKLTCKYCYGSFDYNWSCTADKIILPGLSEEIEDQAQLLSRSDVARERNYTIFQSGPLVDRRRHVPRGFLRSVR